MRGAGLYWRVLPAFLAFSLVVLIGATWLIAWAGREARFGRAETEARAKANLVAALFQEQPFPSSTEAGRPFCERLAELPEIRVTLISGSGRVICDSSFPALQVTDLSHRSEVAQAMLGVIGTEARYNNFTEGMMIYVAVPVLRGGAVAGVVRTADPLESAGRLFDVVGWRLLLAALLLVGLAALLALRVARRIERPLEALRVEMNRLAETPPSGSARRVQIRDPRELAQLAEALNRLVDVHRRRLENLIAQHDEQDAVFAAMVEPVIAVDAAKCILNLNPAGARLLGVDLQRARGRSLLEVVRSHDLLRFLDQALGSPEPLEGEIEMHEPERVLKATGTPLRDRQDRRIGALAVLDDVTRLRRLETIRRDFVANVSHELKTPITSVKGFVETLLDGALEQKETAERFLRIIARHVNRLAGIVEDLLQLSRIEREGESGQVALELAPLAGVLRGAIEVCEAMAEEKGVRMELECDDDLAANINPPLLESAVVNLIGNAVKYSEAGGRIRVEGRGGEGEVVISVRDWGTGIPANHLPRLFERFYRVDPARSRREGGTGLGLAIVKHIAQAHGGTVAVESRLGQGSTFSIHLPRPAPASA